MAFSEAEKQEILNSLKRSFEAIKAVLPPKPLWFYGGASGNYTYTLLNKDSVGQAKSRISYRDLLKIRDDLPQKTLKEWFIPLAQSYYANKLTKEQLEIQLRDALKRLYVTQYALSHGGIQTLTAADYGRIGNMVQRQYEYLTNFVGEMSIYEYTPEYLAWRLGLYANSSTQAFNRGYVEALGLPPNPLWGGKTLPAWPGGIDPITHEFFTKCGSNCKCQLVVQIVDNYFHIYWKIDPDNLEHCDDCVRYAKEWNPLKIEKVPYDPFSSYEHNAI